MYGLQPFCQTTCYSQKLYVDPDRLLYNALGCSEKINISSSVRGCYYYFCSLVLICIRHLQYTIPYIGCLFRHELIVKNNYSHDITTA